MKRISLLTLTAIAALVLAATAAAGNAPGAGTEDLFAQPADVAATPPAALATKSTRKPSAKAKATRHLSWVIDSEYLAQFLSCSTNYWAPWGGWEIQCAFRMYAQQMYTSDQMRFYYWDGGCWRFWKYFTRPAGNIFGSPYPWNGPFYPAQRTCF